VVYKLEENPDLIPFHLRSDHQGLLCRRHYDLQRKEKKKRESEIKENPKKMEEEEEKEKEKEEEVMISQAEKQGEKASLVLSSQKDLNTRGRKKLLTIEEEIKIAMAISRNKVSLRQSGHIFEMFGDFSKKISRPTATNALFSVSSLIRIHNAGIISRSCNLGLLMDGTSDIHQRCPIAVRIIGTEKDRKWTLPLGFREPLDHKAQTQVSLILELLEEVNWISSRVFPQAQAIRPYHILSLGLDNTSSNVGEKGVRGLLDEERRKSWEEDGYPGPCPPLIFVGCEDHLVNLISQDFEKIFVQDAKERGAHHLLISDKHRATDWVQFVTQKLTRPPLRAAFKGFLREHEVKSFSFGRISDTRFAWRDLVAFNVFSNLDIILLFLGRYGHKLTELDKKRAIWILHPEVKTILAVRAAAAKSFLLPAMKAANSVKDGAELANFMRWKLEQGEKLTKHPYYLLKEAESIRKTSHLEGEAKKELENQVGVKLERIPWTQWNQEEERTIEKEKFRKIEEMHEEEQEPAGAEEDEEKEDVILEEDMIGEEDLILGRDTSANPPAEMPPECPNQGSFNPVVVKMGEAIIKRATASKLNLENRFLLGTNRSVEGMFSPAKVLFSRQPSTRVGVVEAQLSLASYSYQEVLQIVQEYKDLPQEVIREVSSKAQKNQRKEFEDFQLRRLEEEREEFREKREEFDQQRKLESIERKLGIMQEGRWNRKRSQACLEKMGHWGREEKRLKASELREKVLDAWKEKKRSLEASSSLRAIKAD